MFDGEAFVRMGEEAFGRQIGYKREQKENFAYCNAVKDSGVAAIQEQARARIEQEQQKSRGLYPILI
ncbi:hypothetical protein AAE02nite_32050 [Adhaeribacter aerolatus]|uniref:Uncharacterized protein n=2 Tax=Adhaeribacter aerolatus TaxID=670289 RepID=A0A512B0Q4_9BACT|nr:hypothetical protein AAE02nite_32050 [Adhaeribacter aerolatus]